MALLAGARGSLFPWVPVAIGTGVGLWFGLPGEPGIPAYSVAILLVLAAFSLRIAAPEIVHPLAIAVGCLALGFLFAGARAHLQAAPVLEHRYYGPLTGRVIEIDRSASDALRLMLDNVVLDGISPAETPDRVRISLHGDDSYIPDPGDVVMATASLAPPEGPSEPGGYDFARNAFFQRLGAVGYTRAPVVLWQEADGAAQAIGRLRRSLSASIMARVPGDSGAFAAGVMTGDRSGLSLEAVESLRDSSLAHLLAISGMNLAFLIGFVFTLVRYGLALVPPLALRVNTKKLAALISFGVALFYLLLSGSNVATERAFVMITVMLGAVLFDRRALTLRSVALAAVVLLLLQPESLLDPGFQMSFAATTALIAGFGAVESHTLARRLPRLTMPILTLVLSSLIGGIATAPYAAAHFNRFTDYGFVANLLTVPVMGAVVMPAGAMAALLAPFGLSALPLWVMQLGCEWILFVAARVSALEGAVTMIPAPSAFVLPVLTLAGIWQIAVAGRLRWLGLVPALIALGLWVVTPRPVLLVAASGSLAGLAGPEGRALSSGAGDGFTAENWLQNDGDIADQKQAAARAGFSGAKAARDFTLDGMQGRVLSGKTAAEQAVSAGCNGAGLLIVAGWVETKDPACLMLDRRLLARSGAVAFWPEGSGWRLQPARRTGRIWAPGKPLSEAERYLQRPEQRVAATGNAAGPTQ
ncbi:ComEC family competence protein [Neotabrizicola shimadae]|uniref:ComEC family competence protein n=2 Tax=Neotabrizicola shimadae TaxID=2807096 RepID=A0A8G0ZYL9_9RHOB|nr:ComEC family competence protein [Neotabrizicola shimadae]